MLTRLLPADQADRFMQTRYGARAGTLASLGAGEWSRAYAFTLDGRDAVVRFGRYGIDFEKDRIMGRHGSARLPIPRVLDLGPAPGGFFAISERVHGAMLDELDGAGIHTALPGLLTALNALAQLKLPGQRGFGGWGPDAAAPLGTWRETMLHFADDDRLPGWRDALAGSPTGLGPLHRCLATLELLASDLPDVEGVIHGDLLHRNVLVDGAQVRGIIDWGNSMFGDPLYEVAGLLFWWPWYPQWADIDIRTEVQRHWAATGVPTDRDKRLRCYQLRIGLEHMAYHAFTRRWDHLERVTQQTLRLAGP